MTEGYHLDQSLPSVFFCAEQVEAVIYWVTFTLWVLFLETSFILESCGWVVVTHKILDSPNSLIKKNKNVHYVYTRYKLMLSTGWHGPCRARVCRLQTPLQVWLWQEPKDRQCRYVSQERVRVVRELQRERKRLFKIIYLEEEEPCSPIEGLVTVHLSTAYY